ncbi:MAG: hypothetical protein GYA36_23425 [Veillonellaceae bacterium]|nr:hypothetical protein [Veillonellaceae bacterium]
MVTVYGFDTESGRQIGLRLQNGALLTQSPPWEVLGHVGYTFSTSPINHTLTSGTLYVLLSSIGPVYIDFDNDTPDPSTAPLLCEDEIMFLPVPNVEVINFMGESISQVGIVEYG